MYVELLPEMAGRRGSRRHRSPVGIEHAIQNDEGKVVAMVSWWATGKDGAFEEIIYAIDEATLSLIPRLASDKHVGNWLQGRIKAKRALEYFDGVAFHHPGVLTIDDCRPDFGDYSYRIYTGDKADSLLMPGVVYHCYVDNFPKPKRGRRLGTYAEVLELTRQEDAVRIEDVHGLAGKEWDDPKVIAIFGDLTEALRVTDDYAIL